MSDITFALPVPAVNQLHEPTSDGLPDNNRNNNCLFASCASALMGFHPGREYDGDAIKDAVLGAGYTGFGYFSSALTRYLADNGVAITVDGGSGGALVALAHRSIEQQRVPLLAVIPSMWGVQAGAVAPSFSTHVVLLSGTGPGWLRAMNPWGGFWHDQTDAWWASRFCYGALWALVPTGGGVLSMGIPANWHDDGTTLTAPNGHMTAGYLRQHILTAVPQWPADLVPVAGLYGISGGGWRQEFAASRSLVSTHDGVVTEKAGPNILLELASLRVQLDAANAQIAALKAAQTAPAPADPVAEAMRTSWKQFAEAAAKA